MVRYSRYRRYRRGRRRYYGYRRYRRSYARRYVNASSKSTLRMKCNQTYSYHCDSGYTSTMGPIQILLPYKGTAAGAVTNNPLYNAYVNLYEETKLIGMKVQLSVTSIVGNATLPSLQIYTAWDRKRGYSETDPSANDLKSMSSSNVATALNNNVAKITRSVYASDLMEKASWHDSTVDAANDDLAYKAADKNPNFFCPAFYFAFCSPSLAASVTVNYTISVTYYVAFRNPKYGGTAQSKDLPSKDVTFVDDVDDNLYMEDESTLLDAPAPGPARAAASDVEPLVDSTRGGKRRVVQRTAHVPITSTKN